MPSTLPSWVSNRAFYVMIAASIKSSKVQQSKFVKKLEEIPKVIIPPSTSRKKALALVYWGLIGQLIGTWTSQKTVAFWLEKNWKPLIRGSLNHFF